MIPTKSPTVSIGVPTYNRSAYIEYLFDRIIENQWNIKHSFEIVISNNASSDNTRDVCARYANILPIKYNENSSNIGYKENFIRTQTLATGDYFVYLADDDIFDFKELATKIDFLLQNTNIVALYAPWYEVNMVRGEIDGKFYDHDRNTLIEKGNYYGLVDFISENSVYSEIAIYQTKFIKSMLASSPLAYWAFTMPAELCSIGDLYYDQKPFYHHTINHPVDKNSVRCPVGIVEAQTWDKYTGGLEHLLGLAIKQKPDAIFSRIKNNIDELVTNRMIVALKLRSMYEGDCLESYFLASRLRGRGIKIEDFESLRIRAGLAWLSGHIAPNYNATKVILSSQLDSDAFSLIEKTCKLPIEIFTGIFDDSGVFLDCQGSAVRNEDFISGFAFYITSNDLFSKFP